jgi:hypothetical protein
MPGFRRPRTEVHAAFGGGGARGEVYVAPLLWVTDSLTHTERRRWNLPPSPPPERRPTRFEGCSIGAVTTLMACDGRVRLTPEMWDAVDHKRDFMVPSMQPWDGFYNLRPLRDLLVRYEVGKKLRHEGWVCIYDPVIGLAEGPPMWNDPLHNPGVKLVHLNELSWLDRLDATLESCAQVPLHHIVRDGHVQIDGGWGTISPPLPEGATPDLLYAFCAAPLQWVYRRRKAENPKNGIEVLMLLLEQKTLEVADRDFRRLKEYSKEFETLYGAPSSVELVGPTFEVSPALKHQRRNVAGVELIRDLQRL